MKKNKEIESAIFEKGLKKWQVAEKIGISPFTFSVWLRTEFTPERKELVLNAIAELPNEN